MSEAIYYDGWHTCANCGADKGGEDIWRDTCPRCAELADLRARIEALANEMRAEERAARTDQRRELTLEEFSSKLRALLAEKEAE